MDNVIKLRINGRRAIEEWYEGGTPVAIDMWYDRHFRHWVLYPVDANKYQLSEARYGFGKAEALKIKLALEKEYGIG